MHKNFRWHAVVCTTALILGMFQLPRMLKAGDYPIEVVSVSSAGVMGNKESFFSVISRNGRFVAFGSNSDNLVPDDTNNAYDVFVHDRETGETSRVSVSSSGQQGNGDSGYANVTISGDGRFVLFGSLASNLVENDTNDASDAFLHDRQTGETTLVSLTSEGEQGNGPSGGADCPVSDDGQVVFILSVATNIVPNDTNDAHDIFLHNLQTGEVTQVSVSSTGEQGNGMSFHCDVTPDMRYIAFSSDATNLVQNDTNGVTDVFVRDLVTGETERVSVSSDEQQGNEASRSPRITADGRFVMFNSASANLVANDTSGTDDIFVRDRETGETTRIGIETQAGTGFGVDSITPNGRFVVFVSNSDDLVPNDTNGLVLDVFVHDRLTGRVKRVNLSSTGQEGNDYSYYGIISDDGQFITFSSLSDNLVPNDLNDHYDVFVVRNPFLAIDPPSATPEINYHITLPITLTWSRVTWATEYEVEVDSDVNFTQPLDYGITVSGNTLEATISTLLNGSYYWRVRAKAVGRVGGWSVVNTFVLDG